MDKPMRYSDEVPYEKRRYWYFTLHGLGPGTIPNDLKVLETRDGKNDKGTMGLYICLDGILNTSELEYYDLRELVPPEDEICEEQRILEYLHSKDFVRIPEIWKEDGFIHIYLEGGDWKHEHGWLKVLMRELGYTLVDEITKHSDEDCYTAEHIYEKE